MSTRRPANSLDLRAGTIGTERDTTVERIIDAMDFLRAEMRRGGMAELADILDEAFLTSLRTYVARQYEGLRDVSKRAGGTG